MAFLPLAVGIVEETSPTTTTSAKPGETNASSPVLHHRRSEHQLSFAPSTRMPRTMHRPSHGLSSGARSTPTFQPIAVYNYSHSMAAAREATIQGGNADAEGQFDSFFEGYASGRSVTIKGPALTLQKLRLAQDSGLSIKGQRVLSPAVAFESSLLPFQRAGLFPSTEQMYSLFHAPVHEQAASGLNMREDFNITTAESAAHHFWPALKALREIDCARKYLEIGCRHLSKGTIISIIVITQHESATIETREIHPPSGKPATHSMFLFRKLRTPLGQDLIETWHASVFSNGAPIPLDSVVTPSGRPLPFTSSIGGPSTKPTERQISQNVTASSARDTAGETGPLDGIMDEKDVDGEVILRAAQVYNNTQLHEKLKALGSTVSYNSVTKRITNSTRARTKASMRPGEDFAEKYQAQRAVFNAQRKQNLAAIRVNGESAAAKSSSNRSTLGQDKERRRTQLEGFVLSDMDEHRYEGDVHMQDGEGDELITGAKTHSENNDLATDTSNGLRRCARAFRGTSKAAESNEANDDEEDRSAEDDYEHGSDDSDISEYEDA